MPGLENTLTIHPLFVHFPIALTLTALLFEVLHVIEPQRGWRKFATTLIYLGALAALVTLATGYMAAEFLGHDAPGHELVHGHRDIMVGFTALLVGLALLNVFLSGVGRKDRFPNWERWARPLLLLLASAALVVGTDRGGRLVFQYGIGVKMDRLPSASHTHEPEDSEHSGPPAPLDGVPDDTTTYDSEAGQEHDDHDHEH